MTKIERGILISAMFVLAFALALWGCDWNQNEDEEKTYDCSLNPDYEGYDCADACCSYTECNYGTKFEEIGECVNDCDQALYESIMDDPEFSEKFKECLLDCIYDCVHWRECKDRCLALVRD